MMKFLSFPAFLLALFAAVLPARADDAKPLVVVELFTSQGCSSCPPADALLRDLAARDDVLALSLHVDYWDYIGWKDPFSSAANTTRQRRYGNRFDLRYVYTPQMVIHGAQQVVGSDGDKVRDLISRHRHAPAVSLSLAQSENGDVRVSLPKTVLAKPVQVWLATFDREHTTEVRRGENSGKTITNANVVHDLRPIMDWNGQPKTFTLTAQDLAARGGDAAAVVVQTSGHGPVLGAATIVLRP